MSVTTTLVVLRSRRSAKRRAGIVPRRKARERTLRVLVRPRIWLTGLIGTALVPVSVLGISAVQKAWFGHPLTASIMGFLLGAGMVSVSWMMWTLSLSVDGSAPWRIGADAEQWTANELHRLGASWQIEHNVPFPENGYVGDVDHIACGPYGVLAVETKWTRSTVDLGAKRLPKEVDRAVKQAEANAGRVRGLLRRVADVNVIPLVVFWGQEVKAPPELVRREGRVRIVAGKQGALWRPLLDRQHLDPEMVAQLSTRVHRWLIEREEEGIGVAVHRRLRLAQRVGLVSITVLTALVALFSATRLWPGVDRLLGAFFSMGGGAIGVAILLLPLMLALAVLGFVHFARRLDPRGCPGSRGS